MKLNPIVWSISLPFLLLPLFLIPSATYGVDMRRERELLIKQHIIGQGIKDPQTVRSMLTVPREEFVPKELRRHAYDNNALPIGYGQTISQPYIVALMTELLELDANDRVLEIGTGSGYQAAILSVIVEKVYTIEIIEPLGLSAKDRVEKLGYRNILVKIDDGYWGWEENAPFDAIIVTAAADHIPPPLLEQLKPGGRMCIPVGQPYFPQVLKLVRKDPNGNLTVQDILPVVFVPFTRADEE
jgi:protein-L-isoaspartate(D-aspartate) O-methyltransferase